MWFGKMGRLTYIANHAVVQRLVGGLVEFRPACDAYQVVLVGWSASGCLACHRFDCKAIECWSMEYGGSSIFVRYGTRDQPALRKRLF
jgi:hypothetical protein